MKFSEIGFRLKLSLLKKVWKLRVCYYPSTKLNEIRFPKLPELNFLINNPEKFEINAVLREAECYLNHNWKYFNYENIIEDPINWHQVPNTNIVSPKIFSFDIDFHNYNLVGNGKDIWEKNRHHHLTLLSLAYCISKEEKFAEEVKNQIFSWIEENPYLIGINWTHPLESAIRMISWVWCERLLRNSKHYDVLFNSKSHVWTSIYLHQKFIAATYSRGSSANNHLIGEMAGLYIVSTAFPCYDESDKWQKLSKQILENEIVKQTFSSGCNKEQAFSYQIFVIEFLLLAAIEAKNSKDLFSSHYLELLKKMIEIVPLMTDVGGNLPRYGDGDEGMVVQLQPINNNRVNWIYQIANQFLNASVPVPQENMLASQVLGFQKSESLEKRIPVSGSYAWKDSGIYSLVSSRGSPDELFVLADAGPHGYLSISAHGHSDALSFTLSASGIPFIVDPGTYAYLGNNKWREYFKSTRAHNTLIVDNQEQSESQGPFLWKTKANGFVKEWETYKNGAKLVAFHDGYKKIGVIHQRTFELKNEKLIISDEIQGNGNHKVEIIFHLHPNCIVSENDNNTIIVSNSSKKLKIDFPRSMEIIIESGEKNSGWYSPKFGVKTIATTITGCANALLPTIFSIEIKKMN